MSELPKALPALTITILTLAERGVPKRRIARQLEVSRGKVLRVLKSRGHRLRRVLKLDGCDELLRELFKNAEGNVALAHLRLKATYGIDVSYATIYRRLQALDLLGPEAKITFRFETAPGEESQSDTSNYTVELGGMPTEVILYRVVLAFSRYEWGRFYLRFRRPDMKRGTYLAFQDFGGTTCVMVIDNTHLAVHSGTGKDAEIEPEMAEFARALGFVWLPHEIGHADRKGKGERGFYFVETNFLPGRTFRDIDDLNAQYDEWRAAINARVHGTTGDRPFERLAVERPHLLPLPKGPIDLSEVVARKVTVEGFVNYETNRYSVPARFVGKTASIHADDERVRIFIGPELIAQHARMRGTGRRVTDLTHHPRPEPQKNEGRVAYLATLHAEHSACAELMASILEHHPNHFNTARRRLDELIARHSAEAMKAAAERALRFRAYDVRTLERILNADWHRQGDDE